MTGTLIRTVNFHGDGSLTVEFMTPADDVRRNGLVVQHALHIPVQHYDDGICSVLDAARALLADALDDFDTAEPIDDDFTAEPDDGPGPYDHPDIAQEPA